MPIMFRLSAVLLAATLLFALLCSVPVHAATLSVSELSSQDAGLVSISPLAIAADSSQQSYTYLIFTVSQPTTLRLTYLSYLTTVGADNFSSFDLYSETDNVAIVGYSGNVNSTTLEFSAHDTYSISFSNVDQVYSAFNLRPVAAAAVPEPATLLLLLIGLGVTYVARQ